MDDVCTYDSRCPRLLDLESRLDATCRELLLVQAHLFADLYGRSIDEGAHDRIDTIGRLRAEQARLSLAHSPFAAAILGEIARRLMAQY